MAQQFLSKKDILKELTICARNPVYFIDTYCKITDPVGGAGLIPFKTWNFQKDLIQNFKDYQFNVILKSRQLGISTIVAAYVSWLMLFHRERNIMVIATQFKTAGTIVKKVKGIITHLPPFFDQLATIKFNNQTKFTLTNGSEIKASTTSPDAGRSETLSLLVVDEAAHIDNLEEIWAALGPTMAAGGRCIALSSPNGVGNWFHKTYIDAESGDNNFHPTKLNWDVHPDRDQTWLDNERKAMPDKRKFAQEYECSFLASGRTVIEPEILAEMEAYAHEPKLKTGFDRNLYVWEEYMAGNSYILTGDVARGDGSDFSALHVFKLESMEQVAEYQGKITTDLFAKLVNEVGQEYGSCMVVIENNTLGHEVCNKLIEMKYPNLYFQTKGTHEYVPQYQAESMTNVVAGFAMSIITRPLVVAKLEEFIRNKIVKFKSKRIAKEFRTFIWNNAGKPEAMRSYNDDLIISAAIACWIRETVLNESIKDVEYKKASLGAIITAKTQMNTRIPGMQGFNRRSAIIDPRREEHLRQQKELGWLFKG